MEILLQRISAGKGDIVNLKELESKHITIRPLLDSLIMFINVALTFFIALPLGQEGPSVFLIASLSIFFFRKEENPSYDDAIDIGAAIGYGLAFYNPLVGICFGYEAMRRKFSWKSFFHLIVMMGASYLLLLTYRFLYEGIVTSIWSFSFKPSLYENGLSFMMNGNEWWLVALLPLLLYIAAFLFNHLCTFIRPVFRKGDFLAVVIAFVLSVVLVTEARGDGLDYLLGPGSGFIDGEEILPVDIAIYALVVRLLFSSMAFSFPHAGGQAIPTLSLGALMGLVYGHAFSYVLPISENAMAIFTIVGALSFYSSSTTYKYSSFFLIFTFGNPLALALPMFISTSENLILQKIFHRPPLSKMLHDVDKENLSEKARMSISFR